MHLDELETPALAIDLDIMDRNLHRAAAYAHDHNLRIRPHTKTHKIPELAVRQLSLGAAGITVAKVGEAEVMMKASPRDLLVFYPVLGESKLRRLSKLAHRTRVTVALDNLVAAAGLSEAAVGNQVEFGVLAELDVGMGRAGTQSPEELAALVRDIVRLPNLRFDGIAFYPGHIQKCGKEAESAMSRISALVDASVERLHAQGTAPAIVSGGSTPTLYQSHLIPMMNELRPGTYIFNDRNTMASGACGISDCAAFVLATVVSTARPGQALIDGGSKTFSSDRSTLPGFGEVMETTGVLFSNMNEEHGYLDTRASDRSFSVGDRLRIVPNHICAAMNLHERVYGFRGGEVECVWEVEGRGKLQ